MRGRALPERGGSAVVALSAAVGGRTGHCHAQPTTGERLQGALGVALLASVLVWTIAWYWNTATSMASIWWRSDTFAHGMVVYPISLWLIWRKRDALVAHPFQPSFWALGALGIAGFGWLLGALADVQAAQHFMLAAMIVLAVWAIVGTRIVRVIAFPLAFTLLAVPVGEFLLPILIEHTADFTVGALRLTGIPVYREGNQFVIPSGSWSVVEACSGLRYLIASITLGLLYAYLTYRSRLRRGLFVLASIIVPIVANWVRAYMIVMIGHLSNMKLAAGVDHLIYGWVFFGVVMLVLFWVGSYWREDVSDTVGRAPEARRTDVAPISPAVVVGAVLVAAVTAMAPSYASLLERKDQGIPSFSVSKPAAANGWTGSSADAAAFHPHFTGSRSQLQMVFEKNGRKVGLYLGYYAHQREGTELISFRNGIVAGKDRQWRQIAQAKAERPNADADVMQTRVRGPNGDFAVWHWYWVGGVATVRPQVVKLRQAIDRLLGAGDDAAIVVLYTDAEGKALDAEETLSSFYQDMRPAIEEALEQTRRGRRGDQARMALGAT